MLRRHLTIFALVLGLVVGVGGIRLYEAERIMGIVMLTDDSRPISVETASPKLVETDDPNVFEAEIDGEKRVMVILSDTSDSVRVNPK
jgi:hypothetical protein